MSDRQVKVWIPAIHCITSTEPGPINTDDELYLLVVTNFGGAVRIPSVEGYYIAPSNTHLQQHGWGGHMVPDQHKPPVLWDGLLRDGQVLRLTVAFADQDNKDIGKWSAAIGAAAGFLVGALTGDAQTAKSISETTAKATSFFAQTEDEYIGGMGVFVSNVGGRIGLNWAPGLHTRDIGPNPSSEHGTRDDSRYFELRGDSPYNAIMRVSVS